MDQYEGSYVVRLLLLCLSPSHLTFLLFLISFFPPGSSISLGFILSIFCLSLLHFLFPFLSFSQSLSSRTRCARRRRRMTMFVDRTMLWTMIFRLLPEFPILFTRRERNTSRWRQLFRNARITLRNCTMALNICSITMYRKSSIFSRECCRN